MKCVGGFLWCRFLLISWSNTNFWDRWSLQTTHVMKTGSLVQSSIVQVIKWTPSFKIVENILCACFEFYSEHKDPNHSGRMQLSDHNQYCLQYIVHLIMCTQLLCSCPLFCHETSLHYAHYKLEIPWCSFFKVYKLIQRNLGKTPTTWLKYVKCRKR